MPQHIECVAAYFLYNLAYNVCFEVLRFNVFEYFRQGGDGCVGGVHKDYVAGFQVFRRALENQIGIMVAPIYRVARPHNHRIAQFFASVEHSV